MLGSFSLELARCIKVQSNSNIVTAFLNGKDGDSRHTYAIFSEVLPLAVSLSGMHTRVALNIFRKIQNSKTKGII